MDCMPHAARICLAVRQALKELQKAGPAVPPLQHWFLCSAGAARSHSRSMRLQADDVVHRTQASGSDLAHSHGCTPLPAMAHPSQNLRSTAA